jgi:phytoene dehydrogenase-like protein
MPNFGHRSTSGAKDRVIVIGGGHNGLTAACYLAKAGLRVTVLEAGPRIGGMTSTYAALEDYPDHLLSAASIDAVYWRASSVGHDLSLATFGLDFVEHDPAWAWLGPDGESLIFRQDVDATVADIARFSSRDAQTYRDFVVASRKALDIQDLYGRGRPTRVGAATIKALAAGMRDRATRDLLGAALTRSAAEVIDGLFISPQMRGAFAAMGNILGSITVDGSGIAALATAPLHKYGVGRAIGGMQAIPDALQRCLIANSGEVRLNSEVTGIDVRAGSVEGTVLADGQRLAADYVVASCAPQITGALLDPEQVAKASVLRAAPANALNIGCFKVDLALGGQLTVPLHERADGTDMRKPTMMFGTFEQVLEAERQARQGQVPSNPPWWATILSATDPSQAPAGQDVLYLYSPTPVRPIDPWTQQREHAADTLISAASEVLAGIKEYELGRVIETPEDLERRLHAPNGCIYHVDQSVTRLGPLRPGLGWGTGDRQVRGLFLGGAGTHPSGGVSGIPGQLAARAILSTR